MLNSFKIKNFKKFTELDLQNFSRINVFVGNNNSGKSTILETIELVSSNDFYTPLQRSLRIINIDGYRRMTRSMMPIRQRFDIVGNVEDFLFNQTSNKQATFAISGANISSDTVVSIGVDSKISMEQFELIQKNDFHEQNLIKQSINYKITVNGSLKSESSIIVDSDNGLMSTKIRQMVKLYNVEYFQTKDLNIIGEMYSNLVKNKQKELLIDCLKDFDEKISNIELLNGEFSVDIGKDILLPINYLGAGIVSIVYLMIYILNIANGVLLIDELENGIYYKKFETLIKTIDKLSKDLNVQLFITTHSEDFIRKLGLFSELSFYRLNPKFTGGVMCWDRDKTISYIQDNSIEVR